MILCDPFSSISFPASPALVEDYIPLEPNESDTGKIVY